MRRDVSETLFCHHYVEMRSDHRGCDGPIDRGHAVALLLFLPKVIAHAFRAAMVLHNEPYPYDKWLEVAARGTSTGRAVGEHVDRILDLLDGGALRLSASQDEHPITLQLMEIRRTLVAAAGEHGIEAEWLHRWWLYMTQSREAVRTIRWSGQTA